MNKSFEEKQAECRNSFEYFYYNILFPVSNNIYQIYDSSGLSKKEFSKRIGISPKRLNKILGGFENVDVKLLARICWEFDFPFEDLFKNFPCHFVEH